MILVLFRESYLVSGEFGDVYQGALSRPDEEPILVAVKTLKVSCLVHSRASVVQQVSLTGVKMICEKKPIS